MNLVKHRGFRAAHPRADHFIPIYIGAGAGGPHANSKVLAAIYGAPTFAFDY